MAGHRWPGQACIIAFLFSRVDGLTLFLCNNAGLTRLHRLHMAKRDFDPIYPGEVLLEEFLRPMGISQYRLAKEISVPQRRISEIVQGKRSVTADTALRLGRYFGMEAQFWLNLQSRYDLQLAEAELEDRLDKEVTPHAA